MESKHVPFRSSFIFHLACNFNFIIFLTSFIFYSKGNSKSAYIHQQIPATTEMFFLKQEKLEALIPFSHLGKKEFLSVPQERIPIIRVFFFLTFYLFQINFTVSNTCVLLTNYSNATRRLKMKISCCSLPYSTHLPTPQSPGRATLLAILWYLHSAF